MTVNTLAETDALHADWVAVELGSKVAFGLSLGDACKLLASINQAWCGVRILSLLGPSLEREILFFSESLWWRQLLCLRACSNICHHHCTGPVHGKCMESWPFPPSRASSPYHLCFPLRVI